MPNAYTLGNINILRAGHTEIMNTLHQALSLRARDGREAELNAVHESMAGIGG